MQVVSDMFLFILYYLYLIYLRNINDMILYAALQIDKENSDIIV
jgi:hypothetical protein